MLDHVEEQRNLLLALYVSKVPEEERIQLIKLLRRTIDIFEQEELAGE